MKITGENPFLKLEAYVRNIKEKREIDATPHEPPKEVVGEDKVVLSPKAREIQEAKRLLDSMPEIREEKVARLKEQIEKGIYRIEEEKIAEKMMMESLLADTLPPKSKLPSE